MKKQLLTLLLTLPLFVAAQEVTLTEKGFLNTNDNTKDYVIIDVPNKTKENLFIAAKQFVNTFYNNPKYVSSEVNNEQIVIDGRDSKPITTIFRLSGNNLWSLNYKYDIQFKDNKVKFTPYFKNLTNPEDATQINLVGSSFIGNATGIYNSKGKILREKAKISIDKSVNDFILAFKQFLLDQGKSKSEW